MPSADEAATPSDPSRVAAFLDADNMAAAVSSATGWLRILDALATHGTLTSIRAYGDWAELASLVPRLQSQDRYPVQLIHLPTEGSRRKNGVDIALAVDAMDTLHLAPSIGSFALITGDADFTPLATRLRDRGRRVLLAADPSTVSRYLLRAADELIDVTELTTTAATETHGLPPRPIDAALAHAIRDLLAAAPDDGLPIAELKQRLQQRVTGFAETDFGATTFREFLATHATPLGVRLARITGNRHHVQLV